jgi:hypothetical protein
MDSKISFKLASGIHPAGVDVRSNCGCDRWVSGAPAGYGLNIERLNSGLYFLKVSAADGSVISQDRFVKD